MSACERLTDLEDEGQEALWVKMLLENNNRPFTIGCVYRPPDSDSSIFASSLEQSLKNIQQHSSTVILTGDFNARCREWFEPDRTDFCGEKIAELFHTYSLEQRVNFRTNFHCGQPKACIDLIATNAPDMSVTSLAPLGKSDHVVLKGVFPGPGLRRTPRRRSVWCWKRANVRGLLQGIGAMA